VCEGGRDLLCKGAVRVCDRLCVGEGVCVARLYLLFEGVRVRDRVGEGLREGDFDRV